ncbi:unnamed protein product [Alternaria alternata]
MGIEAPDKPEHQFIRVSTWGSFASDVVRNPAHALTISAEEAGALDHGKDMLGLWEGLKPVQAEAMRVIGPKDTGITRDDKQALEELRRIKVPKSSSVDTVARFKKLPVWTHVDGLRRVVVKLNTIPGGKTTFYELVNRDPKTMLCEAYPIDSTDFYFHEYRTDTMTSYQDRGKAWRKSINAHLAQVLNNSLDNGGFRPARSTDRAQWPRRVAKLVGIQGMVNQLASTGSEKLVYAIELAIQGALIDLDVDFNQEAGASAQKQLAGMFTTLGQSGYLTVDMVLGYGKHLRTHQTPMTYNTLKASLSLYIQYQRNHPDGDTTDDCESHMASNMSLFHVNTNSPPPKFKEVSTDQEMWLKDHIEIMQNIVDSHHTGLNTLIDYSCGTASGPDTMDQLWENYANSLDIDATKHFALQATRYFAKAVASEFLEVTKLWKSILAV